MYSDSLFNRSLPVGLEEVVRTIYSYVGIGMIRELEKRTLDGSLAIQIVTLCINFFALTVPLDSWDFVLKEILGLETFVQIIELIFYVWYRNHLSSSVIDITRFRYYDWFITTPIMLISTAGFYAYLEREENKEGKEPLTLLELLSEKRVAFLGIVVLNALMLLFGYLQEINMISIVTSSILGFLSLLGSFGILYTEFVQKVPTNQALFFGMFTVWSLYGFAAMLPSSPKNISYNVLDIIAKNFYGIFLSYIMISKSQSQLL